MKNKYLPCILACTFLSVGCSTISDSIILGLAAGAGTGSVISKNSVGSDPSQSSSHAAMGAIVGAATAYFIHKGLEKRDEKLRRQTLLNLERYDVSTPHRYRTDPEDNSEGHSLSKPVIDLEYVETKVEGDKLIEGHRVWRIIEKSKWIPQDSSDRKRKGQ